MAVVYRFGTGRYLDEDRRWYVVEDPQGNVLRVFVAGTNVANGSLRRHSGGDLMVATGEFSHRSSVILSAGRTGEWAVDGITDVGQMFRRVAGEPYVWKAPQPGEVRQLSALAEGLIERLYAEFLIMRGPRRSLLFGAHEGNAIRWNTLGRLEHPSIAFRELARGENPEYGALVTRLLAMAQVRTTAAGVHQNSPKSRAVLREGVWYLVSDNGAKRIADAEHAMTVNVPAFNRAAVPFGWHLSGIKDVRAVLNSGTQVYFPVEGEPPGTVLVPITQQEDPQYHLVLAVSTLASSGVVGLTVVRTAAGTAQTRPYNGPWQPRYYLTDDNLALVLPACE